MRWAVLLLLAGGACAAGPFVPSTAPNMNGKYILSETPQGTGVQQKFPSNYRDYPGGVEYFDVYSPPIKSLYSQVFWTGLEPVDLPADIVERYKGKGMAVVGFEMDQVRRTEAGDVSVPINVAYNHHFESNMIGAKSRLEKVEFHGADDPRKVALESEMGHGVPLDGYYMVKDLAPGNPLPTSQAFGAANGGEYRKSYHGYAPGYVQVIESPEKFQITPMQIDTWHREKMNVTGGKFVAGPLPRNSLAPEGAEYSGLLECPVTTRIRKEFDMGYTVLGEGQCANPILTSEECFAAAGNTLGGSNTSFVTGEGNDPTRPKGCSATVDAADPAKIHVFFNKAGSGTACGAGRGKVVEGTTQSLVKVTVQLNTTGDMATIRLAGPAGVWFGVGFNASAMKDSPWAVIVDGEGAVTERKLQDQNPGTQLAKSVTVVSSTVSGGVREVVLTRPLKGASSEYYTFDPVVDGKLPFINAIGSGPQLAYHKEKTPSRLSVLPVGDVAGMCICASKPLAFGEGTGQLVYQKTNQSADTGSGTINCCNRCQPEPRSDMLAQKNPTCDIRTYVGGQTACHHMFSLLDADQEIPWADQPLEYHLKFRFWVQPYNASYHTIVRRVTWGIASPVEYDVPKCDHGIPGCAQQPDGSWVHTIRGTYTGGGKLVAAHFHCHAPTCLSMAMYRCDKSVKECNETTGTLLCRENPVYGGSGKVEPKFDESGYILQPPCLWGDERWGLQNPVETTGYILHSVKTSNATFGHHGEMAWQQMFVV